MNIYFLFSFLVAFSVVAAQDAEQAPKEYTDDTAFKKAVLNSTNTYRKQHNATSLAWNNTLAEFAENWGESCEFGHSGGPNGENLASGYPNTTASIVAWGHEREEYDFAKGEFSKATGHFTQLVWKATSTVGCSRKDCSKSDGGAPGWYVVCEYWPRGNVIGAFTENVQERVPEGEEPGEQDPDETEEPEEPDKPDEEKPGGGEECMQGALCGAASARSRASGMLLWVVAWGMLWSMM